MTGSSLPAREFSMVAYYGITTGLDPARRAAVFAQLPDAMRQQAWRDIAERAHQYAEALRVERW